MAASRISTTFSAFRSPEREKLKEPTNDTSSATTTFACMKSCTPPGAHGVDGFPENAPRVTIVRSSGIFHALTPFLLHCRNTSSDCVSSITPATWQRRSLTTSTRVPRIGPALKTGEAMRIRLRARPMCFATRCDSASPFPGVNHGRTEIPPGSSTGRGSTVPVPSTTPRSQSWSNASVNANANRSLPRTRTTTFSWRVHESSVQFIEPVQTSSASRTQNLWCIRSGIPAMPRVSTGNASIASGRVSGGGGTGIGPGWSTLYTSRTRTPRWCAASSDARTSAPASVSRRTS